MSLNIKMLFNIFTPQFFKHCGRKIIAAPVPGHCDFLTVMPDVILENGGFSVLALKKCYVSQRT